MPPRIAWCGDHGVRVAGADPRDAEHGGVLSRDGPGDDGLQGGGDVAGDDDRVNALLRASAVGALAGYGDVEERRAGHTGTVAGGEPTDRKTGANCAMPKMASQGNRWNRLSLSISRAPPRPSSAGWKMKLTVPLKSRDRRGIWLRPAEWRCGRHGRRHASGRGSGWRKAGRWPPASAARPCRRAGRSRRVRCRFATRRRRRSCRRRGAPRCPIRSSFWATRPAVRASSMPSSGWAWISRRMAESSSW